MSNVLTRLTFPGLSRQLVKKVYLSKEITRLLTVDFSGELSERGLQNGALGERSAASFKELTGFPFLTFLVQDQM